MPASKRKTPAKKMESAIGGDANDGRVANHVGRRVARKFGRKIYDGTVDEFDDKALLWHVAYDDGDAEELDREELLSAMDLFDGREAKAENAPKKKDGRTESKSDEDAAEKDSSHDKNTPPKVKVCDSEAKAKGSNATPLLQTEEEHATTTATAKEGADDTTSSSSPNGGNAVGSDDSLTASPRRKEKIISAGDDDNNKATPTPNNNHAIISLAIPILVALLAIAIWLSRQFPFASAIEHEEFLRSTPFLKFQPDKFQGGNKRKRYFEGWYYKFVTPLGNNNNNNNRTATRNDENKNGPAVVVPSSKPMSMAVVPGIFYGRTPNSNESHAFLFVTVNGEKQHYYRFDIASEFSYASPEEEYYVQVGNNRFTHAGVSLDLHPRGNDDAELVLKGELSFTNPSPWPVSLMKLGAMGPVGWMPFLECTHGVLSFDHVLNGSLAMSRVGVDEEEESRAIVSFDDGRGYTEKDFGRSFPSLWVWIQSNSFRQNPGTSLFVSIARLPVLGLELPGFTAAIWHNSTLIPFATYTGAKFEEIRISEEEVHISMRSSRRRRNADYRVELTVDRRNVPEVLLYAPVDFTKMAPFVWEALQARVHMRLFDGRGDLLVDDVGEYAGLEVHGNVQWLVDNVCGKESANKIICL